MGKNSTSKKDRKKDQEDEVVKQINEQKLKAFSIGTMGKRHVSKKEQEEQRKKEQEQAAAQAFEEYVATFQETPSKAAKVWFKAGTYDAGRGHSDNCSSGPECSSKIVVQQRCVQKLCRATIPHLYSQGLYTV